MADAGVNPEVDDYLAVWCDLVRSRCHFVVVTLPCIFRAALYLLHRSCLFTVRLHGSFIAQPIASDYGLTAALVAKQPFANSTVRKPSFVSCILSWLICFEFIIGWQATGSDVGTPVFRWKSTEMFKVVAKVAPLSVISFIFPHVGGGMGIQNEPPAKTMSPPQFSCSANPILSRRHFSKRWSTFFR